MFSGGVHPHYLHAAETLAHAAAIETVGPYAVDVISAVEDAENRKVPARVHAFVAAVRAAATAR